MWRDNNNSYKGGICKPLTQLSVYNCIYTGQFQEFSVLEGCKSALIVGQFERPKLPPKRAHVNTKRERERGWGGGGCPSDKIKYMETTNKTDSGLKQIQNIDKKQRTDLFLPRTAPLIAVCPWSCNVDLEACGNDNAKKSKTGIKSEWTLMSVVYLAEQKNLSLPRKNLTVHFHSHEL